MAGLPWLIDNLYVWLGVEGGGAMFMATLPVAVPPDPVQCF